MVVAKKKRKKRGTDNWDVRSRRVIRKDTSYLLVKSIKLLMKKYPKVAEGGDGGVAYFE